MKKTTVFFGLSLCALLYACSADDAEQQAIGNSVKNPLQTESSPSGKDIQNSNTTTELDPNLSNTDCRSNKPTEGGDQLSGKDIPTKK